MFNFSYQPSSFQGVPGSVAFFLCFSMLVVKLLVKFHPELEDTTSYKGKVQPMNLIFTLASQGDGSPAFCWTRYSVRAGSHCIRWCCASGIPALRWRGWSLCSVGLYTPCLAPALLVPYHCVDAFAMNKKILLNFSSDAGLSCVLSVWVSLSVRPSAFQKF